MLLYSNQICQSISLLLSLHVLFTNALYLLHTFFLYGGMVKGPISVNLIADDDIEVPTRSVYIARLSYHLSHYDFCLSHMANLYVIGKVYAQLNVFLSPSLSSLQRCKSHNLNPLFYLT